MIPALNLEYSGVQIITIVFAIHPPKRCQVSCNKLRQLISKRPLETFLMLRWAELNGAAPDLPSLILPKAYAQRHAWDLGRVSNKIWRAKTNVISPSQFELKSQASKSFESLLRSRWTYCLKLQNAHARSLRN